MKSNWLSLALYKPQIPQNTGNIGRTCVGLNTPLHIIGKPAFFLDDKEVKRAGLDYWKDLKLVQHAHFEEFFTHIDPKQCYFFSKNGHKNLFEVSFKKGDCLIFGQETHGLPQDICSQFASQTIFLPMGEKIRSYNLSNAVAIAAFEAYRQIFTSHNKK